MEPPTEKHQPLKRTCEAWSEVRLTWLVQLVSSGSSSASPDSFKKIRWRVAPTCWCWLWWHAPPTCCCPVRASLLPRCCVAARSTRLEPWHRPPLSRLRAVLCRWAWPRQVANPRGFLWSSLASWRAPRLLASWLSSSMAPTLVPAAVCEPIVPTPLYGSILILWSRTKHTFELVNAKNWAELWGTRETPIYSKPLMFVECNECNECNLRVLCCEPTRAMSCDLSRLKPPCRFLCLGPGQLKSYWSNRFQKHVFNSNWLQHPLR